MTPLQNLLALLAVAALAAVFSFGVACALTLLRIVLPRLAARADRSLRSLRTPRLVLSGVLPLLGALALSVALGKSGAAPAWGLVVWVPIFLLAAAGAMAAVPHVGERVLRAGAEASPLARAAAGGLVLGAAAVTWLFWPLGVLVTLVLGGWLLGIGLGLASGASPEA